MNFHSFEFAAFFILVYILYLHLGHRAQNRMLLVASYVFYSAWDWRFLGLILLSTITDYFCSHAIQNSDIARIRKAYLWLSIIVNLSILGFFKYFHFFVDNFIDFFALFGLQLHAPLWQIILPVGISFYTFQTISYTIDVYRKQVKPAPQFLDYALYVSFFPQLVAGPIERGQRLLPQILQPRTIRREQVTEGLFLIYWGLFKKIFIADNIGAYLQAIGDPAAPGVENGGLVLVYAYAFLFQIYCDFSAYSDIARGTAKLMGFELMINFRSPLFAPNFQEVWNRWHISLTTWIRDYLYYPLALTPIRGKNLEPRLIVIITFLIMGLWHGASWNFILWGLYCGVLLALYATWSAKTRRFMYQITGRKAQLLILLSMMLTFNAGAFGILLFRANSFEQLGSWVYHLFFNFSINLEMLELFFRVILHALPLLIFDALMYKKQDIQDLFYYPIILRYAFFYLTLYLMVVHGAQSSAFIYFQF